jgi:hypothetical protein
VNAHLKAKSEGKFSDPALDGSWAGIKEALLRGETIRILYEEIEIRYCSITSIILSNPATFSHMSQNYKADIRKGFRIFLNKLNIQ